MQFFETGAAGRRKWASGCAALVMDRSVPRVVLLHRSRTRARWRGAPSGTRIPARSGSTSRTTPPRSKCRCAKRYYQHLHELSEELTFEFSGCIEPSELFKNMIQYWNPRSRVILFKNGIKLWTSQYKLARESLQNESQNKVLWSRPINHDNHVTVSLSSSVSCDAFLAHASPCFPTLFSRFFFHSHSSSSSFSVVSSLMCRYSSVSLSFSLLL
jgi:hypothetical protein